MSTQAGLAIIKALADQSRLAIVNALLERPHYAEELAKRHALAPSTVSFHLRKLEQAGLVSCRKEQYYVMVTANTGLFDATLREIVTSATENRDLQEQRIDSYRRKVLESFFRHGRLEKLPAQHKKRLIVLEEFARRFDKQRRYDEAEVTGLITPLFDDYCTIRRLLVDEGLIRREGTTYWRDRELDAPSAQLPEALKTKDKDTMDNRREAIRNYKQSRPQPGIFQLRCKANGRVYVAASRNLNGERNSRLFQLRMGKVVFSPALQQDLDTYGAKEFEFEVLATLDPQPPAIDPERALAELELAWIEKLQPFGERGYNNQRAYRRNLERLQPAR